MAIGYNLMLDRAYDDVLRHIWLSEGVSARDWCPEASLEAATSVGGDWVVFHRRWELPDLAGYDVATELEFSLTPSKDRASPPVSDVLGFVDRILQHTDAIVVMTHGLESIELLRVGEDLVLDNGPRFWSTGSRAQWAASHPHRRARLQFPDDDEIVDE